ncbi:MAG: DUF697 domain-containing protein [Gloeocapsa sp. DLM2.Bin57]|nr:MAG: DUF697 domain-containing protein [Gloeocapsa sp. DLM2.Bin57]
MGVKLDKPILITTVGLGLTVWLWSNLGDSVVAIGEWSVSGAIALGGLLWLLQNKGKKQPSPPLVRINLDITKVNGAIASCQQMLTSLAQEAPELNLTSLKQQLEGLPESLNRETLTLTITGANKVGKTTLKKLLETNYSNLSWQETTTALDNSDLLLFLVNGDLTESEWSKIQQWHSLNHNIILVFNKQDQYLPEEQVLITAQLKQRVQSIIPVENVIAIASQPKPVKVREHQTDGTIKEWLEDPQPLIQPLQERLNYITQNHHQQLVLATTWREAKQLQQKVKTLSNQLRFERALPIIEQYQWLAAASALANPIAALDLLVTLGINGQMLVDLGKIYQQQFSLSQAQTAAATLGELMLKLGLVEVSTQTIAGMLKTNAITYIAGGSVQAISAAYLTRVAGLSLVEYFQEQDVTLEGWNLDKLAAKIKQVFAQNQKMSIIQNLVKQGV